MTLDAELVRQGLRTLAEVNGRVREGEDVVVVTDQREGFSFFGR